MEGELELARRVIDLERDGLIRYALGEMRDKCIARWADAVNIEEREREHVMQQCIDDFENELQAVLDNGTFVERKALKENQ